MYISEWSKVLTPTQNVDWDFLLSTTLHKIGVILNPITYRCLLKVLCPVRRPVTTLDCVLLKDSRSFLAVLGPEINSRACLWMHYLHSVSRSKFLDSRPTLNFTTAASLYVPQYPLFIIIGLHFMSYIAVISGRPVRILQHKMALHW